MTERTSEHPTEHPSTHPTTHAAEAAERTAAIALWVVVGVALVYGISETAVRVAQLFA